MFGATFCSLLNMLLILESLFVSRYFLEHGQRRQRESKLWEHPFHPLEEVIHDKLEPEKHYIKIDTALSVGAKNVHINVKTYLTLHYIKFFYLIKNCLLF